MNELWPISEGPGEVKYTLVRLLYTWIPLSSRDGTFAYTIIGNPQKEESEFKSPWGVALDPQDRLHIAACSSNCIKVFTPEGTYMYMYVKSYERIWE